MSVAVSPTDAINAIVKDNRTACMKMTADTAGHFAKLAAESQSPRYLRFLSMISLPQGSGIKRNQEAVVTALAENESALLLFNTPEQQLERARLIEANDHEVNPRGRLVYHIELIGLLAAVSHGKNQAVEMHVREMVPLDTIVEHLLAKGLGLVGLPIALRTNYLRLLEGSWFRTERHLKEVSSAESIGHFISEMKDVVSSFVSTELDADMPANVSVLDRGPPPPPGQRSIDPRSRGGGGSLPRTKLRWRRLNTCATRYCRRLRLSTRSATPRCSAPMTYWPTRRRLVSCCCSSRPLPPALARSSISTGSRSASRRCVPNSSCLRPRPRRQTAPWPSALTARLGRCAPTLAAWPKTTTHRDGWATL